MPRNAPRQAPSVAPGQDYGDRQDQVRQQRDLPLPDMAAAGPGTPPPTPGAGAPPAGPGGQGGPEAVAAAALAMAPPEPPPWAGDAVLDEPITAGLPYGAGPGPEVLRTAGQARRAPVAELFQRMAAMSGDPYYGELAQQAQTEER